MILTAMLSNACRKSSEVHYFQPVNTEAWHRSNTLHFAVPPTESDTLHQLNVEVRINRRYAYQDLWLLLQQHDASHTDTLHLLITDVNGNFTGEGRDLLTYSINLPHPILLSTTDTTRLSITHLMDETSILGISDIGIRCTPTPKIPQQ